WIFTRDALLASWVRLTIDTFGRRNLLLFTFPNMAWTLLAAARIPLVALFIFLFAEMGMYVTSERVAIFTESLLKVMGRSTCLGWAAVLSLTFPRMVGAFTIVGATVFLPYWIRKWVFFDRKAQLKPLYNFDEVESITVFEKGAGH
ncbi:hypothetical protein BDQ17DRAFT_1379547, partial [Cyathus striatus]